MTQTETRIFHYDLRGHLIAETNQTGQMLAEYIYLGDQLLSMIKPGESVYYFHNDHLGTPQVLTDDTQTIAWKAVYTPFGEAVPSIQTVDNPFRFPGQYYDTETGLHYNYFRYYNPQTGRYITPDPIGLEGGINLFAYVAGNPVNKVDPEGKGPLLMGVCIGALALTSTSTIYSMSELNKEAEPIEEKMRALIEKSQTSDLEELERILEEYEKLKNQLERILCKKAKERTKGVAVGMVISILCLAAPIP